LALFSGIAGVWLYHEDGWRRYQAPDFHRLSLTRVLDHEAPQEKAVARIDSPTALSARWQELFWALPPGPMRHKLRSLEIDIGRALRESDPRRIAQEQTDETGVTRAVRAPRTCANLGHLFGHTGTCIFCDAPNPAWVDR
jgi:hypothetical protein